MATAPPIPPRPLTDTISLRDGWANAFVRGFSAGGWAGRFRTKNAQAELEGRGVPTSGNPLLRIPLPAPFQRAARALDFTLLGLQLRRLKRIGAKTLKKGGYVHAPGVGRPVVSGAVLDEQLRRGRDRDRARGHTVPPEIIRGQKTPKAARTPTIYEGDVIQRPRVLDVPGIRARVGSPLAGGVVLNAGNQLISIYSDLWYQQRGLRERRRQLLSVGRRGAGATRPLPRPVAARSGAGSTRPLSVPVSTGAPGIAGPASAPVHAGKSAERVSGRRSGGLATPERSTTGHARSDVDLVRMATTNLSTQLDQFLTGRPAPFQPRRMQAFAVNPLTSQAIQGPTAVATAAAAPAAQPASGSQNKPCECPPKKTKKKVHKCSNPIVSRYVKDGVIIIKRKLQCQPSKRK